MASRNPSFTCVGYNLSKIWHCFGNYMNEVDLDTIINMLSASKTNVIPVNTHRVHKDSGREDLLIN